MDQNKIKVTICTGTTCYILGGSNYLLLNLSIPEALRERVEISGSPCMGFCQEEGGMEKTPCLKIGEELYTGLSLEEAVKKIIEATSSIEKFAPTPKESSL
ncbi:MAG: (2Fe-2S) ferredoxin domain-containing protein [Spirochaetales bacterium]|nr:(2Fe-2S) ferredoxin domain-containing protein [Spirochaetales bacterium]